VGESNWEKERKCAQCTNKQVGSHGEDHGCRKLLQNMGLLGTRDGRLCWGGRRFIESKGNAVRKQIPKGCRINNTTLGFSSNDYES
jgi:hypothetical protein